MADGNEYAPGTRVIVRNEEWIVRRVEKNALGELALHCSGVSTLVKNRSAIFLADLEDSIETVDPKKVEPVADASPNFRRSQLFLESWLRRRLPTDANLHVGYRAAMDALPYQLEPAQKALQAVRTRFLIADAVGLGKTLEAGILLSELIARGKARRVLVVTVKSMTAQFQKELWNRFTIPLARLDSKKIHDVRRKLPANYNPFSYYDKTIVSVDTLKRDLEYRAHLENAYWDVIVIDEAQNVAERGVKTAQRAKLAALLANRSDAMIMLSATPHDGRPRSFASLMNILDPTAIPDPDHYTKSEIKKLFTRRFKKDVRDQASGSFKERVVEIARAKASEPEERAFDLFASMRLQMDERRKSAESKGGKTGAGFLFKTTLEKALFSSPAACIKSVDERLRKLREKKLGDDFPDVVALKEFRAALEAIAPEDFSRYRELLKLLRSPEYGWTRGSDDRVVIFTERVETMKFLAKRLREDLALPGGDAAVAEISGGISDVDQLEIVENFGREKSPVRVLVASDVASEGLNLHYRCHRLIHFDIPWSLMVFQQRNGRVDRYGQPERPDIRYMKIESRNTTIRGDARILEILVEKEKAALENLGDPALLMGKFSVEGEEEFVGEAIQSGAGADAFEASLDREEEELDPFEAMLRESSAAAPAVVTTVDEATLFEDDVYLKSALETIAAESGERGVEAARPLTGAKGLEIFVTPEMRRRLDALLPEEARPKSDWLRLTSDKSHMMDQMRRSLANNAEEAPWPTCQYLWPLHPIFEWANERCGLLYARDRLPVVSLPDRLEPGEVFFVLSGSIPNLRSIPQVDEFFALRYASGEYVERLDMPTFFKRTGFRGTNIPNVGAPSDSALAEIKALVSDAVDRAREYMSERYADYRAEKDAKIDYELGQLAELKERRRAYQKTLFKTDDERSRSERDVDELFEKFSTWVKETLEIKDASNVRILLALRRA